MVKNSNLHKAKRAKNDKKYLIIGNGNAITYKEIFPLIKENKMWLGSVKGVGGKFHFYAPEDYECKYNLFENGKKIAQVNNACWFTNLDHKKRHEPLDLYKRYSQDEYPKYDNYDAINVDKTCDIPIDYDGVIGVPITFLDKYCPEQFEIIGEMVSTTVDDYNLGYPYINGKKIYARILIKKIS